MSETTASDQAINTNMVGYKSRYKCIEVMPDSHEIVPHPSLSDTACTHVRKFALNHFDDVNGVGFLSLFDSFWTAAIVVLDRTVRY